jgi:membrane peptidoglycan carboxypeptidase
MQGRGTYFGNIVSLLGAFVATSVVLGLLGAGLVMPMVAATGAAAREGVYVFDSLPGEFTQTPLSQQSRILADDGTLIATPYDENRVIVPLAKIAPIMRQAQIAIEDSRFYEHAGVDPQGIGRALISNLRGGDTQGASTLTQQYVKITLQENALRNDDVQAARAATAKNYTRKLQELKYAVTLEKQLTKDQILQGYLNLVYYGGQAYGVEAAARHFFGVTAAQLDLPQAATLAGLVQLPSQTDPTRNPARALARRNVVLDRMHALKMISDRSWRLAVNAKMVLKSRPAQNSCATSPYPYFCDYIKKWLLELPALGKTLEERILTINRGGLTIQTTLNPKVQRAAQEELVAKVPIGTVAQNVDIGAAAAVIEPGTGHVLAIAQNTAYSVKKKKEGELSLGKTSVNWAVDERYGASNGFAFGSTAKMFAVAAALKSGMPINSTVFAKPAGPSTPALFFRSDFHDKCNNGTKPWDVRNDEGTRNGRISLTDATAFSVNTAFAGLVAKLGGCSVRDLMTQMGLHESDGDNIQGVPSAVTLGSGSVSPLTLASAYATVASGGTHCKPSPVLSITTSDKKTLALPKDQCQKVLEPDVANGVTKILKTVLTKGTGFGNALDGGRPAAGKTGTAGNSTRAGGTNETWFAGYTPQLTTVVWVGTPDDPRQTVRLKGVKIGDKFFKGEVFGSSIAAPIWKEIMDRASAGMPLRDFADPGAKIQVGDFVSIPDVAGMTMTDAKAALSAAEFKPEVGRDTNSDIPQGRAVFTQPDSRALRGSTVLIRPSTGYVPPPPRRQVKTPPPAVKTTPPAVKPTPKPRTLPACGPGVGRPCIRPRPGRGRR